MADEIGIAYLSIVPSAKGFAAKLKSDVGPELSQAGMAAGVGMGTSIGDGVDSTTGRTRGRLSAMIGEWGPMVAAMGVAAVGALAVSSVKAASDLGESINAVNVTFGSAAGGILTLGENAAKAVGMSKTEFNGLAVQFSNFATTIAGPGGDVAKTMGDLTTRAADFASVMNLDVAEAAGLFQSGLAGETEPLRAYGIDLSAAAVETYALANGIATSGTEMTEAQKVQARYGLLMDSTSKSAGDFANTSDSLANRQRIMAAEFQNAKAGLGEALIPAMSSAAGIATGLLEKFNGLDDGQKKMVLTAVGVVGAIAAIGAVIGALSSALPIVTAAQWLWNAALAANPVGLIIIAVVGMVAMFVLLWNKCEWFRNYWKTVWSIIQTVVGAVVDWFKSTALPWMKEFFAKVSDGVKELWAKFQPTWNAIKELVSTVVGYITGFIKTYVTTWWAVFSTVMAAIWNTIQTVWGVIGPYVSAVVSWIAGFIATYVRTWVDVFTTVMGAIWSTLQTVWGVIGPYVTTAVTFISGIISTYVTTWWNVVTTVMGAIWSTIQAVWSAISPYVTTVVSFISGFISAYVQTWWSVMSTVMGAIWGVIQSVWSAVSGFISGAINTISGVLRSIGGAVSAFIGFFSGIVSGISSALSGAVGAVQNVVSSIWGVFSGAGGWLLDAGRSIIQGLINGITGMVGAVKDAIANVLQVARNLLPFSPAKEGPFSGRGWTLYSGQAISESLAEGIESKAPLAMAAMSSLMAGLAPGTNIGVGFAAPGRVQFAQPGNSQPTAAAGGMTFNIVAADTPGEEAVATVLRRYDALYGVR